MSAPHRTDKPVRAEADLEQLSAWLDGELDPGQHGIMLERLKNEPELRAQFEWFNLAGDALRSHEVAACHSPALVEQVSRALESEPVRIGPGALSASKLRRHIATGVTVAAAAGVLAVVALPQLRTAEAPPAAASVTLPIASVGHSAVSGAALTPPKALAGNGQLDAYFRAHRELAATGVMPSAVAYIRMSGEPDR